MPTKKTTKSDSKISRASDSKNSLKEDNKKRVVVKRRKTELVPTKASAVAIASQASRAKKQALIERVASTEVPYRKVEKPSDTKIPLWVRVFFGCSLLLFCVSFYKAIIYPQLDWGLVVEKENVESSIDWDVYFEDDFQDTDIDSSDILVDDESISWIETPETAVETIEEYFSRLSNRNFDWAFDLMIPALRTTSVIKEHFTSFRMNPFLDWIEWWRIVPTNFKYVSTPTFWRDKYSFDLSYTLISTQEKYDEIWEFVVDTKWEESRITSISCVTSKCSYHPIFWPENYGLMR